MAANTISSIHTNNNIATATWSQTTASCTGRVGAWTRRQVISYNCFFFCYQIFKILFFLRLWPPQQPALYLAAPPVHSRPPPSELLLTSCWSSLRSIASAASNGASSKAAAKADANAVFWWRRRPVGARRRPACARKSQHRRLLLMPPVGAQLVRWTVFWAPSAARPGNWRQRERD
jgi:hypothetical protein